MRQRAAGLLPALALLLAALAPALLAGCRRPPPAMQAQVQVEGNTAVVTIQATGVRLYRDSHAHLSLNGGPEVMLYSDRPYRFRRLAPGTYTLRVWITDQEHRPLPGLDQTLTFTIP